MTEGAYQVVMLVMGAIIAALIFVVFKNGSALANGVPQPVVLMLLNILLPILKEWATGAAKQTPTTLDDEAIRQAIALLESLKSQYEGKALTSIPAVPDVPVEKPYTL